MTLYVADLFVSSTFFRNMNGLIQQLVVMYFSALTNLSSLNGSASEYDYN
ncbi:hypothetical protein AEBE7430_04005 [Aeromonas bestiarum]|jgi:hypothetical protein